MQTKKISFILAILFATFFSVAKAQSTTGLSSPELTSIVQQCIDLPGLHSLYPVHGKGEVSIVNFPFVFPSEVTATVDKEPVHFISKESIAKEHVSDYFMFRSIKQTGNTVTLVGNYFKIIDGNKLIKSIAISYSNSTGAWAITNSTIN